MNRKVCQICNKQIKKGDRVAVISSPVEIKTEDGDYDLLSDFLDNEKLYHIKCFVINKNEQVMETNKEAAYDPLVREFTKILRELGENITLKQTKLFIDKFGNNETDCTKLLQTWLLNRKNIPSA